MANATRTPARTVSRQAAKAVKRLHPVTKAVMIICLVLGILAGAAVCYLFSRNDRFQLKGQAVYSFDVGAAGETYLYTDEGVDAVCFGRDVSDRMHAETTLQKNADGQYIIPLNAEGVYTITYTVDAFKFGTHAPNGQITRVRTFAVSASEEDGRSE